MTLIVGVKCSDGIVLGADSVATYATQLGQPIIRQDTVTKLHITSGKIAVAVSGPISLSQNYSDEMDSYIQTKGNKVNWRNTAEAKTEISRMFWKHAGPAWEKASVVAKAVGGAAHVECLHSSATAFAIGDEPHLIQFSMQCNAEEVTQDLPFVALGSGQPPADTFLAFIRRIFWPLGLPSLIDGQIATIWTLDEVIKTNPGGVGGEVKVVLLRKDEKSSHWKCSELSVDEIDTHRQLITDIENRMRTAMEPPTIPLIPSPSTPPL